MDDKQIVFDPLKELQKVVDAIKEAKKKQKDGTSNIHQ